MPGDMIYLFPANSILFISTDVNYSCDAEEEDVLGCSCKLSMNQFKDCPLNLKPETPDLDFWSWYRINHVPLGLPKSTVRSTSFDCIPVRAILSLFNPENIAGRCYPPVVESIKARWYTGAQDPRPSPRKCKRHFY